MRKLYVRVVVAILFSSSPVFAQSVVVGSGSWEEVGPGAQVVVQPAGVDVQSGGSFVMAGSGSTALARFIGPASGVPISVQSGGSIQLTWAKLENLTTLTIAAGGSLLRIRETTFEDSLALASPWIDISAVIDRESIPFSFNRVTFQGNTSRKNIKASSFTPMVRILGNSASPGNKWGSGGEDDPGNVISWHSGIVTRANPSGVYDTVEEALRATDTVAWSTITVNLGHAMIDDVVDFNTVPSNGASSAGPTVVSACLAPLIGKSIFDSDVNPDQRGKIVNCVVARGFVEETTAENCTFFDPRLTVIAVSNITCTNCLVENGTGISLPANCITTASDSYFASAAMYDFHLGPGGISAIDAGTSIIGGVSVDFEGTPRACVGKLGGSASWDIGADEIPCAPPTSLTAESIGSSVSLSWAAVSGATSYNVRRSNSPGGPYTAVPGGSGVTSTAFTDTGLAAGTYYYALTAATSTGESFDSSVVTVTILAAPTGLSAVAFNSRVSLTWNQVSGATSYQVKRSKVSGGPYSISFFPTETVFLDEALENGTTYYYVVAAVSSTFDQGLSSSEVSATPFASSIREALLVVGGTPLNNGDALLQSRLQNLGYAVTVKVDGAANSVDAIGKGIVVLSSTVNAATLGSKFTDIATPLINCSPGMMSPLGMTGSAGSEYGTVANQTQVSMDASNTSHPLAAGLSGTITVLNAADSFTFGNGNFGGVKIATLPTDTSKSLIFGYEAGELMPGQNFLGQNAPAARVGFFFNSTAVTSNLSVQGGSLFDAAVLWAAPSPATPLAIAVNGGQNSITVSWGAVEGALSYTVLRGLSATGPFSEVASGVTRSQFVDSQVNGSTTYFYQVIAANFAGASASSLSFAGALQYPPYPAVTIVGPFHIRSLRQNPGPGEPDYWNTGIYTAKIQVWDGTAWVNPTGQIHCTWTTGQGSPAVVTAVTNGQVFAPDQSPQLTLNASLIQSSKDSRFIQVNCYITVDGTNGVAAASFPVEVSYRTYLGMYFRFPQNPGGAGQTQMEWPPGQANQFFVPDDNPPIPGQDPDHVRFTARNSWAQDYVNRIHPIMKQKGIKLYWLVDRSLLSLPGTFDPSGKFLISEYGANEAIKNLHDNVDIKEVNTNKRKYVNVYMVHKIVKGTMEVDGLTHMTDTDWATTVLLADLLVAQPTYPAFPQGDPSAFAHEFGHVCGIPENVSTASDIDGTLNNLNAIGNANSAPETNPVRWNLMGLYGAGLRNPTTGALDPSRGWWLTDQQVLRIRSNAKDHPSWHSRD